MVKSSGLHEVKLDSGAWPERVPWGHTHTPMVLVVACQPLPPGAWCLFENYLIASGCEDCMPLLIKHRGKRMVPRVHHHGPRARDGNGGNSHQADTYGQPRCRCHGRRHGSAFTIPPPHGLVPNPRVSIAPDGPSCRGLHAHGSTGNKNGKSWIWLDTGSCSAYSSRNRDSLHIAHTHDMHRTKPKPPGLGLISPRTGLGSAGRRVRGEG